MESDFYYPETFVDITPNKLFDIDAEAANDTMLSIEITGALEVQSYLFSGEEKVSDDKIVVPGANVSSSVNFMRGHGTYLEGSQLVASVAGAVFQVNKLISVQPVKSRYNGEIGDVVVGRIVEVQQKRWKVETNSRLFSTLMLSSVNLPGGELRRKSVEDELMMRDYLKEGDLISAEVQKVSPDGQLQLHTRNLRYGKLSQGTLIKVSPYLVKRRKSHFHTMPYGASLILGRNGNIWISTVVSEEEGLTGGYAQNLEEVVPHDTRSVIARYANCINLLANHQILLYDTTITLAYEASVNYEVKDLLKADVAAEIAYEVQQQLMKKVGEV